MTVQNLIAYLKELPQHLEVIIQKDGEGNDYSPLAGVDKTNYYAKTSWSGECYRDEELGSAPRDCKKVVVLYPVN